jgi:hypothetical protein
MSGSSYCFPSLSRLLVLLLLSALVYTCGCVRNVEVTQVLNRDPAMPQTLVITLSVEESYISGVNDAVKRIHCSFTSSESGDFYKTLTYTSKNCLIDPKYVTYAKDGNRLRYSINSAVWNQQDFQTNEPLQERRIGVSVDGFVSDTNGMKVNDTFVVFRMSDTDVNTSFVYYVEYAPGCASSMECGSSEACNNSRCTPFKCDLSCARLINHSCIPYGCCTDEDCNATNYCSNHTCVGVVPASACGEALQHKWVSYQCCSDDACQAAEACKNHSCTALKCQSCEYVENHRCMKYDCCDDGDCAQSEQCQDHTCRALGCSLYEKAAEHQCSTDIVVVALVVIILFTVFALVMHLGTRASRKKVGQEKKP